MGSMENVDKSGNHPLLLVHPEKTLSSHENPKLVLNQANLELLLQNVGNRPLSIFCVAGPQETGKTLLFGYMAKYLTAAENDNPDWIDWDKKHEPLTEFQWSSSMKAGMKSPDTPGIWSFYRPFIITSGEEDADNKEVAVLLLYAQSSQCYRWTKEDAALIGLAIVASSCTIFNMQKQIDENCFSTLASHFKYVMQGIKGNGSGAASATTRKTQAYLGKVMFVIRDWNFPTEYPYGVAGGKRFLKEVKLFNKKEHSRESRLGRTFIQTMFEDVSGCLLPIPEFATLKPEFKGSIDEMGKFFVDKLGDLISEVVNLDELPLKREFYKDEVIDGGIRWKALIEGYLNAVNDGEGESKKPLKVAGFSDSIMLGEQREIMKRSMKIYGDAWKGLLGDSGKIPKDDEVKETHRRARRKALEAFQNEIWGGVASDEEEDEEDNRNRMMDYLKTRMAERFQEIKVINEKKRDDFMEKWKMDMIQQYKDSMEAMFPPSQTVPSEESFRRESEPIIKDLLKDFERKRGRKNLESEREKFIQQLRNAEEDILEKKSGVCRHDYTEGQDSRIDLAFVKNSLSQLSYQSSLVGSTETLPCIPENDPKLKNSNNTAIGNMWPSSSFEDNSFPSTCFVQPQSIRASSTGLRNRQEEERNKNLTTSLIERLKQSFVSKMASGEESCAYDEEMDKKKILEEFQREVPFSKESQEFKLFWEMLDAELKMASSDAKMNRQQKKSLKENNLKQAVSHAVAQYQSKLKAFVEQNKEMTSSRLEQASGMYLCEELQAISKSFPTIEYQNLKRELEEGISGVFEQLKEENEANSQQETRKLITSCKEEYVKKMTGAMEHAKDEEDLYNAEVMARNKIMEKFKKKSDIHGKDEELDSILSQTFTEMKTRFTAKLEATAGMVKLSIANACQFYCEEMDKHLKNEESILPADLLKMHEQVAEAAVRKVQRGEGQVEELKEALEVQFQKYEDFNKMKMKGDPIIGIDLGTTFSCQSIYSPSEGKVKIIPNSMGKLTTPSYVLFQQPSENGGQQQKIVGEEAKTRAYENPEGTIFDAKRILGRKFDDEKLQDDMKLWPFSVVDGGRGVPMIEVNGDRVSPEIIAEAILSQLKKEAEDFLKRKVKKAVITVPAYFTDGQRQATIDAGRMAKFEKVFILAEPVAAAMAYNLQYTSAVGDGERHILVFDLGGGTFDVAILKISKGKIDVLNKDGDTHLGGKDFDQNMMTYCVEEFKKKHKVDLFQDKDSSNKKKKDDARCRLNRLQAECERQKVLLTTGRSVTVSVKRIFKNLELSVKITRAKFERLNEDLFKKTIQVVDRALKEIPLDKSQIGDIVLVGGSTRIPKIQRLLQDYFDGKQLDKKINPDEAVAHGAGLYAAIRKGDVTEGSAAFTKIRDITPMSIGVELYGGGFDVIIPKSTKLPVKLQECYKTAHNNQTSVQITIYEGENPIAVKNEKLGDFYLNGIPPKNAGSENIDVEMVINEQGILHVTAKCTSTGTKKSKTINVTENKQRIGEAAIQRHLAAAENDSVVAA